MTTDDDQTHTNFPTEPAPPSDELNGSHVARDRAALALLAKIETTAKAEGDNHYELRQLSKAYREIVGPDVRTELVRTEIGATLEDATLNHVAALEHFYDCIRFDCHLLPRIGPVSHEDVRECLDAARGQYNKLNVELLAVQLEIDATQKRRSESDAVCNHLRAELQAANEDAASVRAQLKWARAKISSMVDVMHGKSTELDDPDVDYLASIMHLHDEKDAETNAINVALQDALKWTGLDFKVDSYIRRKDAIRALAVRAEGLKLVRDAIADAPGIDITLHPNLAVRRLIDHLMKTRATAEEIASAAAKLQISVDQAHHALDMGGAKPRESGDTVADRIQAFAVKAGHFEVDLDVVKAENKTIAKALGLFGKTADLPADAAKIIQERDDLAKRLDATRGALQIANSQLQVANSNLQNALKLQQIAPDALAPFIRKATKIIAFWRRGDESYQLAANELENALVTTLGASWTRFKNNKQGANEIVAILAIDERPVGPEE